MIGLNFGLKNTRYMKINNEIMKKITSVIAGTLGLCFATFIAHRYLNIEANIAHLYFMVVGLLVGVLINFKNED